MRSLRQTLIGLTLAVTAVVGTAADLLLYEASRTQSLAAFDAALRDKARAVATALEQGRHGVRLELEQADLVEFRPTRHPSFLEVRDAGGQLVYQSPSLAGRARLATPTGDLPQALVLPNGLTGRALALTATPRRDSDDDDADRYSSVTPVTLVLARDTDALDDASERLAWLLVVIGLCAAAGVAAALAWAVGRGLRPVNALAAGIDALGDHPDGAQLALPGAPVELQPVVDRLNDLLRRLAGAFERERSFAADVAHELRTPLAGVRTTLEVTLSRDRTTPEYAAALNTCLGVVTALGNLVEDLLLLARLDAGRAAPRRQACRPAELVQASWSLLAERSAANRQELRVAGSGDLTVFSDPALVSRIVTNLLDNAVSHGGAGVVQVDLTDGWMLVVTNPGSQLNQSQAEQAFARFWRGDAARTDVGSHCGLGLSFVRAAAEALGGIVSVETQCGGIFKVTVDFRTPPEPSWESHV